MEERQLEAAIDYMLFMSDEERFRRHEAAARVVKRLKRTAARHGLRATGWTIFGPARDRVR